MTDVRRARTARQGKTTAAAGRVGATAASAREKDARGPASGRGIKRGAASTTAAPAVLAGTRTLVLAMPWRETTGFGAEALALAQRIEVASEARIRFEMRTHAAGGIDVLAAGAADVYFGSEHGNLRHDTGFAMFAGLPFFAGLEAPELVAWLDVAGGQSHWDRLAAGFGVKAMLAGHTGRAPGLWSVRPIETLGDLIDKPVVTVGLGARVIRALGGRVADLEPEALRGALERDCVSAVEYTGTAHSIRLGLPAVAPFHMGFGLNTAGTALSLGMRRSLWDSLSAADRAIFEVCAGAAFQRALGDVRAHETILRRRLAASGVTFDTLAAPILDAFATATDGVMANVFQGGSAARKIHESYMEFKASLVAFPIRRPIAAVRDQ